MRTSLLFLFLLLFGSDNAAQELVGSDQILPGTLASFEIIPAQEASWHVVMPSANAGTYQIDTGLSKIYFASPERGNYTVIAGIVLDGKPQLLTKTFINGEKDVEPLPLPPVASLATWIKIQIPILVKSNNLASEIQLVSECFDEIVRRIDDGNIKTPQNAQTQLQITLTSTLALASPTAVTDWMPFLTELSRQLEHEFGGNISDMDTVKKTLQNVSHTLKSLELPKTVSTLPSVSDPNIRNQVTPNRVFRTFLSK
jgi:hypothetical protein